MYVVNQDGTEMIELQSIRYDCHWSERYEEEENRIGTNIKNTQMISPMYFGTFDVRNYIRSKMKLWKQEHPYEYIIDIYVNGNKKVGEFYSEKRGVEEFEKIIKAFEDGVIVYRMPESNESERYDGNKNIVEGI